MNPQYNTPRAWAPHGERTAIVRAPREHRCGVLWFIVGAALVIGPVALWRRMAVRPIAAAPDPTSGVILHAASARMWIDGVRVDAASVALPCGTHSVRAEAMDPPLFLDVTCPRGMTLR